VKALFGLLKDTFSEWKEDKASRLAAALSYYTVFSLAPLLIIVIAIVGLLLGQAAVQKAILDQFTGVFGPQSSNLIQTMIESTRKPAAGIVATVIGIATLVFGALGVFGQLKGALNTMWEVEPKPGRGIWGMIKDNLLSFTMILGIGFLLLVSLALSAGLSALNGWLAGYLPGGEIVGQGVNLVISFLVITLLFGMIFRILPDAEISWKDVWLGAAVTALLFSLGKLAIGLYLGHSSTASAYGAAGSLIVILLWVYYSAQILFFGAEFTQVYARKYGSRIVPDEDAVPVTEEMRAQQGIARTETRREGDTETRRGGIAAPSTRPQPARSSRPAMIGAAVFWLFTLIGVALGITQRK
jgi:membrane protein